MKTLSMLLLIVLLFHSTHLYSEENHSLRFNISVDPALQEQMNKSGRLFVFITTNPKAEPRYQLWPMSIKRNHIFAQNFSNWNAKTEMIIDYKSGFLSTSDFNLNQIPAGTYFVQTLWDQNTTQSSINAAGNLYSEVVSIEVNKDLNIELQISEKLSVVKLVENKYVKMIDFESELLSKWWGKPISVKASVLLPSSFYDDPKTTYPIRYNVAGINGRYTRINRLMKSEKFSKWWMSEDAPQIITVFLDGEGPFGDSYQLDSDNSGPYGSSLINELMPLVESKYRADGSTNLRFVDGCSTGGWVSLALQIFYPDTFNGVWSYSPDSVDFENYQLINIYEDQNVFYNEWNNLRPVARDISGDPIVTMRDFIRYENILGTSNSYVNSGGQFSSHTALYSTKGENGLPVPLFNHLTGEINQDVSQLWKKYDLKHYLENNWETLGPKLQGKIYLWMGDMDNFYLNPASRALDSFLKSTENPKSDATLEFSAMEGHCTIYSHKDVLKKMMKKVTDEDLLN